MRLLLQAAALVSANGIVITRRLCVSLCQATTQSKVRPCFEVIDALLAGGAHLFGGRDTASPCVASVALKAAYLANFDATDGLEVLRKLLSSRRQRPGEKSDGVVERFELHLGEA